MSHKVVLEKQELAKHITIDVHLKPDRIYDFRLWTALQLLRLAVWLGNFTLGEVVVRLKDTDR